MSALIKNKKVGLNYEILDKFQSGIQLFGFETKTIKNKLGSLDGSYIIIRGDEVFLINAFFPPYQVNNTPKNYDSRRPRKLLLTKKEIRELVVKEKQAGLTLIPISLYNKGRHIKLEFAIAKGKKKHDKRQDLKKKEANKEIERTLKNSR